MRRRIWLDFVAAVLGAFRRQDERALNAERHRGVQKLADEVVRRDDRQER